MATWVEAITPTLCMDGLSVERLTPSQLAEVLEYFQEDADKDCDTTPATQLPPGEQLITFELGGAVWVPSFQTLWVARRINFIMNGAQNPLQAYRVWRSGTIWAGGKAPVQLLHELPQAEMVRFAETYMVPAMRP